MNKQKKENKSTTVPKFKISSIKEAEQERHPVVHSPTNFEIVFRTWFIQDT